MAILGAEPAVFDAYERGIATEYRGTVPAWLFRLNRRRFLKALLGKPRIYLSDFFHERLHARARANLWRAINAKRCSGGRPVHAVPAPAPAGPFRRIPVFPPVPRPWLVSPCQTPAGSPNRIPRVRRPPRAAAHP